MPATELIRSFLQRATAHGSRSTALNPLAWCLGILLSALVLAAYAGLPGWILVAFAISAIVLVAAFLTAYFFLLFVDRDALRSERFTLSKMAMERSVTGDSLKGFLPGTESPKSVEATVVDDKTQEMK